MSDAGGPAAVNFALRHPTRAAGICLMNAFYGESPGLRAPEFIELFTNKNLKALTRHFLVSPLQFAWLRKFQRGQMQVGMTETQKARYNEFLGPIVDKNFTQRPSAAPAFAQMTYQLVDEMAANTARLSDFRRSDQAKGFVVLSKRWIVGVSSEGHRALRVIVEELEALEPQRPAG
jgi:haloalkane dehalogenase